MVLIGQVGQPKTVFVGSCVFSVAPASGWVLDTTQAKQVGLPIVSYPKSKTMDTARAIMYANSVEKADTGYSSVEAAMMSDKMAALGTDAKAVCKAVPSPAIAKGRITKSQILMSSGAHKAQQQITYIDTPKTVVFLVLSAKSQADFTANQSAYAAFVRSYKFVASQPKK